MKIVRSSEMWTRPIQPITRNQTSVIGPKKLETAAVPLDCTANSMSRMTTAIGTTYSDSAGVTSFRPSTAERTDKAGVIIASPMKSAAPAIPMKKRIDACPLADFIRRASNDSVPPSPWLSARSRNSTYLIVTIIVSVQIISEIRPIISTSVTPSWETGRSASRKA
ncbi:hypothetical protein D9M68_150610 [compost metagenome]